MIGRAASALEKYAPLVAALLVVVGVFVGLRAGSSARPAVPTVSSASSPTPTIAPTLTRDPEAAVFAQPLSAGCATTTSVWVFSDGGGIGRWDGRRWELVDPTLRSLLAAACTADAALAVGRAGSVVTADDLRKTIRADTVGIEDLLGVSVIARGSAAMAVGGRGTVLLQTPSGWQPYAVGIQEDLHGVVVFGLTEAWVVGSGGVSYRLEPAGWRPVATGVTSRLRAIGGSAVTTVIAAGDDGVLVFNAGHGWARLPHAVRTTLRSAAHGGGFLFWAVGDDGAVLVFDQVGGDVEGGRRAGRFDIGTTCTLRAVFSAGPSGRGDVWIIGSEGARAGAWRVSATGQAQRWGSC